MGAAGGGGTTAADVGEPGVAAGALTLRGSRRAGCDGLRVSTDGREPLPTLPGAVELVPGQELFAPRSAAAAALLRERVPWTRPRVLGRATSVGAGDRLGVATPGHVAAFRAAGGGLAPVLAQQSIREMSRTGRTPQQVLDDATWGVLTTGWTAGFGADADHVRRPEDLDACADAGYTQFTLDPGDVLPVRGDAGRELSDLPWDEVDDRLADARRRWTTGRADGLTDDEFSGVVAQYLPALAHVLRSARRLQERLDRPYEIEVCVDETGVRTSPQAHRWFAAELVRLGVPLVGFAPCFAGSFQKGVEFVGDLDELRSDVAAHADVVRHGQHKLSVHSGSDKFSIYPLLAELTGGRLHLKTSGTSWLTALRTAASVDPALVRGVYAFALTAFAQDVRSYHVAADPADLPRADDVADADVVSLLDRDASRQVLHVTYGAVLTADDGRRFREPLLAVLAGAEPAYTRALQEHLGRHLEPLVRAT